MFERFTERSRQAVAEANKIAFEMGSEFCGVQHLVLGLYESGGGDHPTVARRAMEAIQLDISQVRAVAAAMSRTESERSPGSIPFTEGAKQAMEYALREALSLGQNYVGTEHLYLALVRLHHIEDFPGRDFDEARQAILDLILGPDRQREAVPKEPAGDLEYTLVQRAAGHEYPLEPEVPTIDRGRLGLLVYILATRAYEATVDRASYGRDERADREAFEMELAKGMGGDLTKFADVLGI